MSFPVRAKIGLFAIGMALSYSVSLPAPVIPTLIAGCIALRKIYVGDVTPDSYVYQDGFYPFSWKVMLKNNPGTDGTIRAIEKLTTLGRLSSDGFVHLAQTTLPLTQTAVAGPPSEAKRIIEALIAASRRYDLSPTQRKQLHDAFRKELGNQYYNHPDSEALHRGETDLALGQPVPAGEARFSLNATKHERMFSNKYIKLKSTKDGWSLTDQYGNSLTQGRRNADGDFEYLGSHGTDPGFDISLEHHTTRNWVVLKSEGGDALLNVYSITRRADLPWGELKTPAGNPSYQYRMEAKGEDAILVTRSSAAEPQMGAQFQNFLVRVKGDRLEIETLRESDRNYFMPKVFSADFALPSGEKLKLPRDRKRIFELLSFAIPHMRDRTLDY